MGKRYNKSQKDLAKRKSIYHSKVGTMHFAPTISPAPKNIERSEIESLYEGIRYYLENGINEIAIQPKYMGSYCDILFLPKINECKIFTRRGKLITWINSDILTNALKDVHSKINWNDYDYMLIQAELMPWSALGENLIEKEFDSYLYCVEKHNNYLEQSNIFKLIESLKTEEYYSYLSDKDVLSKQQLNNKYKAHNIRQFKAWHSLNVYDIEGYNKGIDTYKKQLEIFSVKTDMYIKPFNVLKFKKKNEDNETINFDNYIGFSFFNDDEQLLLNINDNNFDKNIKIAYDYYSGLIENNAEGVMIKPRFIETNNNIAPVLKVRNNDYLTMIYGINFKEDYEYYCKKRNINKKIKQSINQFEIARQMLSINLNDIVINNEDYTKLIELRMEAEYREVYLDSRL